MKKKSKILILATAATLTIGVGLAVGVYFYSKNIEYKNAISLKRSNMIMLKAARGLRNIWNNAPVKYACESELGKLNDVDENYLKNNPNYLECFLSRSKIKVIDSGESFFVFAKRFPTNRHYQLITKSLRDGHSVPHYGVNVLLTIKGRERHSLMFVLEDSFHETYLPQRKYGVGPFVSHGKDWTWDNFGVHYFVDKYLVTYRDLIEWKNFSRDFKITSSLSLPKDRLQWSKPATGLSVAAMKRYCAFRGKELIKAHVYDAATFHPVDLSNPNPIKVVRGPYPWSYKRRVDIGREGVINKKLCDRIYLKDCLSSSRYEFYDTKSSSWIGIYQILGGVMEVMDNVSSPSNNTKISSYYFDLKSPWHRLGVRGKWDGEDYTSRNFDWRLNGKEFGPAPDIDMFKVGFRCMRRVKREK